MFTLDLEKARMTEIAPRTYSLASCYENSLTTILRLASMAQSVPNSQGFRTSIRAALKGAMEQAKALGYSSEINQLAFFAVVAILDESVLKLQSPAFADWAQRPMQEEMFGHARAGEIFFENLRNLLARPDSQEVADCLEVYCLCMLLGFRGQYALSSGVTGFLSGQAVATPRPSGEIQALVHQARDKINRIRGPLAFLPTPGAVPEAKRAAIVDRWSRGLGIAALCLAGLVILAWVGFYFILSSGTSQIS
jgi:type VI secretion system protein ImpK